MGKIRVDRRWMGKKMKEQKRCSKTTDIVSYALEVSVNGVTCVCSPFPVIIHILKLVNWLNCAVNFHVSKTCVPRNNLVLHKALLSLLLVNYCPS